MLGLFVAFALLVGVASCTSDDDSGESSDAGSSMDLTPRSEDADDADDADDGEDGDDGDGSDPDSTDPDSTDPDSTDEGSESGGSEGSGVGPVEPVELTAEEEAFRTELLAAIDVDEADAGFDMECLTGRWIRSAGLERLNAEGVTPEALAEEGPTAIGLSRDEAVEFVRDYERCGMDLFDFILSADLDAGVRGCITDAVDRDDLEAYVAVAIMGQDEEATAMQDQISAATTHCTE